MRCTRYGVRSSGRMICRPSCPSENRCRKGVHKVVRRCTERCRFLVYASFNVSRTRVDPCERDRLGSQLLFSRNGLPPWVLIARTRTTSYDVPFFVLGLGSFSLSNTTEQTPRVSRLFRVVRCNRGQHRRESVKGLPRRGRPGRTHLRLEIRDENVCQDIVTSRVGQHGIGKVPIDG